MTDSAGPIQSGLVSVIIANYNGAKHLDDCLNSLKAQTYSPLEIFVIDNGSTDDSAQVCQRHGIDFVFSGGNDGLATAYNFGVNHSRGEFAFVANNDIWVAPDCIERLVAAMRRHGDQCFAADPKQFNWDASSVIHYCVVLRPLARLRQLFNTAVSVIPLVKFDQIASEEERPVPFASAGAMMVRRKLFDELGGFDRTFFMDMEDVDVCWRANRRGWSSIFVASAWIRHKWNVTNRQLGGGAKSTPMGLKLGASQHYNTMRFALKNYDALNAVLFVALKAIRHLLTPLRPNQPNSTSGIHAMVRIVRTLPEILRQRRVVKRSAVVSNSDLLQRFTIRDAAVQSTYAVLKP